MSDVEYDEPSPEVLAQVSQVFADMIPHNRALGLTLERFSPNDVRMRLPYDHRFVGNPATGVLHGGVITTLLDSTCGAAVFAKLMKPIPAATLDLRIDYLKPARAGEPVIASANCYRITRNIAFVRGVAFEGDDEADPVAIANGTFILFRRKAPR